MSIERIVSEFSDVQCGLDSYGKQLEETEHLFDSLIASREPMVLALRYRTYRAIPVGEYAIAGVMTLVAIQPKIQLFEGQQDTIKRALQIRLPNPTVDPNTHPLPLSNENSRWVDQVAIHTDDRLWSIAAARRLDSFRTVLDDTLEYLESE